MVHQSSRQCLLGIFIVSLFMAAPGYAVQSVKVSSYGAGHQIWFEAEDFDERDPADNSSFALSDEPGAFGRSISSVNSSDGNGMIRYTFDISLAGGSGGSWYFWGRVINPSNNSDFMLVDGHPGDPVPFTQPVTGLVNDQRAFEENVGSPPDTWGWSGDNHNEAHTKTLRDGENTMYFISRESGARWDVLMWTDDPDYVPTDEDYMNAEAPVLGAPSKPSPADGATDVPRDGSLSWTPGKFAVEHDVYFGTVFSDVNEASRDNPLGVLVSPGQAATSYDPAGVFEYGRTYYWRVDEVNAAPDSTIFQGGVWSFTAEPFTYPIENITATASSAMADAGPENTINGSGLDSNDLHSDALDDMWLTAPDATGPAWIQYEFDGVYKLYDMMVWNYNVQFEVVLGYGFKDVTIEISENGTDWAVLAEVEFAKATSADGYASNTTIDLAGASARFVRLTANDNWGMLTQYGLSEVRFTHIPVQAREPIPATGAQDVSVNTMLNWRAGR
ncbi:MAG: discoidin domain-containing protein, partial [Phycisphaerales bacterium]